MRRRLVSRVLTTLALVLVALPSPRARAGEEAPVYDVGFGVVNITPDRPVPLGGYAERFGRLSTGVHDPVKARAMVIAQGKEKVAIVSADLVGISAEAKAAVVDLLGARGFSTSNLMLTTTHTHAGPGGLTRTPLFRPMMGLFDRALFEATTKRIAEAVGKADDARKPARLSLGSVRAAGLQRNRAMEGGPVPDLLSVLRADTLDGKPLGLVVHFAAHPTILGSDVRELSAEWPGATCDAIEKALPGATAMVLQGALGDVSPAGGVGEGFARVTSYGGLVAERALEARGKATTLDVPSLFDGGGPRLISFAHEANLPFTIAGRLRGDPKSAAMVPERKAKTERQSVWIGSLRLVAAPGEPTAAFGARVLERAAPSSGISQGVAWVVACANDHLGYLTTRDEVRRGGYESSLNLYGPELEYVLDLVPRFKQHGGTRHRADRTGVRHDARTLRISGETSRALGRAHGELLRDEIRDLLVAAEKALVEEAREAGLLKHLDAMVIGTGLRREELVIPLLALAARGLQKHIPAEYLDEMEGIAEGAGVPYDSILLENTFLTLAEQASPEALLRLLPHCTNVAAFGEATTLGQPMLVSTLDWGMIDLLKPRTITLVVEPPTGSPFVSVTWPGMVGTLRAMGAQGLAISEESVSAPNDTSADGVPINLLLRDVIQHGTDLDDAVERVRRAKGTAGYHVTILDGVRRDARTVEVTATRNHVRKPVNDLLAGCDPTEGACFDGACDASIPRADGSSVVRYASMRQLLAGCRGRLDGPACSLLLPAGENVVKEGTLLACVFEPQIGRFHVSLRGDVEPDPMTGAIAFETYDLPALLSPTAAARMAVPRRPQEIPAFTVGPPRRLGIVDRRDVSFPSPVRTGVPSNDTVRALWFTPADAKPVGAVIQLPAWKERNLAAETLVAMGMASRGIAVLLMPLPWQVDRAAPGVGPGEWTLSSDLSRTRAAWLQGAQEVYVVSQWIEATQGVPPARQGVFGISLGGHVAGIAYGAYPDRFRAGVFVLAGGGLEHLLSSDAEPVRELKAAMKARGVTEGEVREVLRPLDPATWARPERKDGVFLVGARADEVVPPEHIQALADAYGGAQILWLEGSHTSGVREAPRILAKVVDFLRHRFETP